MPEVKETENFEPEIKEAQDEQVEEQPVEQADDAEEQADDVANEEGDDLDDSLPSNTEPQTKGQSRHQRLANAAKSERERAEKVSVEKAKIEAELDFFKRQHREIELQNQMRVDSERLANMEPQERMAYEAQMRDNYWQGEIQSIKFKMEDGQDRAIFKAKATIDENYANYEDQVEKLHASYASNGQHYQREDILKHLLGDELLKNRASLQSKRKERSDKRVAAVSTKPTSAKSDGNIQRRGKSLEEILDGVEI